MKYKRQNNSTGGKNGPGTGTDGETKSSKASSSCGNNDDDEHDSDLDDDVVAGCLMSDVTGVGTDDNSLLDDDLANSDIASTANHSKSNYPKHHQQTSSFVHSTTANNGNSNVTASSSSTVTSSTSLSSCGKLDGPHRTCGSIKTNLVDLADDNVGSLSSVSTSSNNTLTKTACANGITTTMTRMPPKKTRAKRGTKMKQQQQQSGQQDFGIKQMATSPDMNANSTIFPNTTTTTTSPSIGNCLLQSALSASNNRLNTSTNNNSNKMINNNPFNTKLPMTNGDATSPMIAPKSVLLLSECHMTSISISSAPINNQYGSSSYNNNACNYSSNKNPNSVVDNTTVSTPTSTTPSSNQSPYHFATDNNSNLYVHPQRQQQQTIKSEQLSPTPGFSPTAVSTGVACKNPISGIYNSSSTPYNTYSSSATTPTASTNENSNPNSNCDLYLTNKMNSADSTPSDIYGHQQNAQQNYGQENGSFCHTSSVDGGYTNYSSNNNSYAIDSTNTNNATKSSYHHQQQQYYGQPDSSSNHLNHHVNPSHHPNPHLRIPSEYSAITLKQQQQHQQQYDSSPGMAMAIHHHHSAGHHSSASSTNQHSSLQHHQQQQHQQAHQQFHHNSQTSYHNYHHHQSSYYNNNGECSTSPTSLANTGHHHTGQQQHNRPSLVAQNIAVCGYDNNSSYNQHQAPQQQYSCDQYSPDYDLSNTANHLANMYPHQQQQFIQGYPTTGMMSAINTAGGHHHSNTANEIGIIDYYQLN